MKISWEKFYLKFKKLISRFNILDWLVILVVVGGLIFFFGQYFHQAQWINIYLISYPGLWVRDTEIPYWYADAIKPGDAEYDSFSRKTAEVVGVEIFESAGSRKDVLVRMRVKGTYNRRNKQFQFRGQNLNVGTKMTFRLGSVELEGTVRAIGELVSKDSSQKTVKLKIISEDPWVVDALEIGDKVVGIDGKEYLRVTEKRAELADIVVTTAWGDVLVRKNPLKKDAYLTVEMDLSQEAGLYYFYFDQKVKVGDSIFLPFPNFRTSVKIVSIGD
ncbi:hypothetical protein COT75_01105 [Candidatus Beckwithbacteria bacterium CG10_big_fil_rev_8_21_14_0_10_34_10]|uniref:Uncharacterized protein n=1 Tax=Candidatus Beckwithbacteria bacterium CG10_big_fil_rev_8_21_14_0_10_34_10 TaxID=1974495 RepID=A0A2H0WA14_9BACT|nr:MAG: hypothetical protein COT75_01105 [Candidatus Beckwithbacteria bacterium CG10_big_fil_rev_8_21_14_0_10_34_10]